jgi:hypothetical protein
MDEDGAILMSSTPFTDVPHLDNPRSNTVLLSLCAKAKSDISITQSFRRNAREVWPAERMCDRIVSIPRSPREFA